MNHDACLKGRKLTPLIGAVRVNPVEILMRFPGLLPIIFVASLAAGCRAPGVDAPAGESDPEALALLDSIDVTQVHAAFDRLAARRHDVTVTIQAHRPRHEPYSSRMHLRQQPRSAEYEVMRSEESGSAPSGVFSRLHGREGELEVAAFGDLLIEREPAFLEERNRSAFVYRMGTDTVISGRGARTLRIESRPGEDQGLYDRAHLFVARGRPDILGFEVTADEETLFYSERAIRRLTLAPDGEGVWIPYRAAIESDVKNFLSPRLSLSGEWTFRSLGSTAAREGGGT